jgi:hypothetical protein
MVGGYRRQVYWIVDSGGTLVVLEEDVGRVGGNRPCYVHRVFVVVMITEPSSRTVSQVVGYIGIMGSMLLIWRC